MKMRTLTACLLAGAMSLGAYGVVVAQAAPAPAKKAAAPYKAPKNTFGQPDLEGAWTNASLTKLEREASFGDRLAMTPEETRKLEGDTAEYLAFRNQPTKPDTKIEDLPCSPGFVGTNCGYNAGWTDPGDSVMRVGGQPRASFITFPANGRVPAAKGAAAGGRGGAAQAAPSASCRARPNCWPRADGSRRRRRPGSPPAGPARTTIPRAARSANAAWSRSATAAGR